MNGRNRRLGLLLAASISLAGCASARATNPAAPTAPPPSGAAISRGGAAGPSASARMICEPEIGEAVTTILALRRPPRTTSTWVDHRYTCTYRLPVGPLVLSVQESSDVSAARKYFNALRERLGTTRPLRGLAALGLPAYDTSNGTVVFLKDSFTLRVDATGLPRRVGPHHESRGNLAYTVASDVLGCWTEK